MIDINSASHSNNNLEIIQENGVSYVRKTFYDNIERAIKCVNKQLNFKEIGASTSIISAATVFSFDVLNDFAVLKMPFIEGLSGSKFATYGTRLVASYISRALSNLIYSEMAESKIQDINTDIFSIKLVDVISKTNSCILKDKLSEVLIAIEKLPNKLKFPVGPCHGDLTLSNIILNPADGVVLIDFLDTFFESPLQDVAKINQDFICGWSFRKEQHTLQIKSTLFCNAAYPNAVSQLYEFYETQIDLLTIMALARIAPYVTDKLTEYWLEINIQRYLQRGTL